MRIAGLMPPCTVTLPTPESSLSRWARRLSERSLSWRSEIVLGGSASVTIGASAGFTLEEIGGGGGGGGLAAPPRVECAVATPAGEEQRALLSQSAGGVGTARWTGPTND